MPASSPAASRKRKPPTARVSPSRGAKASQEAPKVEEEKKQDDAVKNAPDTSTEDVVVVLDASEAKRLKPTEETPQNGDKDSTSASESAPVAVPPTPSQPIVTQGRPRILVRSGLLSKKTGPPPPPRDSAGLEFHTTPPPSGDDFNVTRVISDFLYVGAGFDEGCRSVANIPGDGADAARRAQRADWFRLNNVQGILNMAGNPNQAELLGISYPTSGMLRPPRILNVDMNDLDEWTEDMLAGFEKGASFIESLAKLHVDAKRAGVGPQSLPKIFVHCVAGVNRSPMVVVWWLVKYHGFEPRKAWDLVRTRRDAGVGWKDMTLGGPAPGEDQVVLGPRCPKNKDVWFKTMESILGAKKATQDAGAGTTS